MIETSVCLCSRVFFWLIMLQFHLLLVSLSPCCSADVYIVLLHVHDPAGVFVSCLAERTHTDMRQIKGLKRKKKKRKSALIVALIVTTAQREIYTRTVNGRKGSKHH